MTSLSPPSMHTLSIAMQAGSPSGSFSQAGQYFYGGSSPPDRQMGAMMHPGAAACYGGGPCDGSMQMGPPMMGEWGMGGGMPPQQMMGACGGGMYEGQMMYAAGPQGGPQFAPVGCGQPFYGQPGCEQAGYYGGQPGQQQYVMPGPPVNAAPPMRLAVSTGSNAGNGNGKQRGRSPCPLSPPPQLD